MPLGRMNRAHPWNTSSVVADDGFRETKTMNKTFFDPTLLNNYKTYSDCRPLTKAIEERKDYPEAQTSIQTNHSKSYSILNQTNLQKRLNDVQREVKMNISDFGSTFRKHGEDHERHYMLTTYQQAFDRIQNPTPKMVIETEGKKLNFFSGYNVRPDTQKGIKMISPMTGEVFKTEKDPQQNTRVQRSWLPYVENSIKVAEENLQKTQTFNSTTGFRSTDKLANYKNINTQLKPHDIATSLPMGDGVHSVQSKYMEPGSFRRIRSDVTLVRNKTFTKR